MRSIEFLREGPGNDQLMSDAEYAAQRAQGEQNWNNTKGFVNRGIDAVSDFHKKNTERFNAKQAADAAANSPAGMAAAKANLTPSQLKWLGSAQPNPEILQRMPAPQQGETPAGAAYTQPATGLTTSGSKPAAATPAAAAPAAKPAPPGTSIDPIVRQRLGYGPATQKEIADYQAANPGYGKVVDSSGRPITTGSGGPVAAGGEQSVIKAAQTAAPALPTGTIDPNAGELGNQTPGGGGVNRNAGELGNQDPSLDTIRKNAGLVGTQNQAPDAAAQAGRIADRMDAEAGANTAGTEAPAALPTGTIDPNAGELGNQTPGGGGVNRNAGELGNQDPSTRIPSDEKYPATAAPQQIQAPGEQGRGAAAPTATAPTNRDSMPFKQAFADARASGVPTFTWKGKSYSTQLAKQSATPNPFPAGTVKNAAGGLTTTNAGGAATSVTRNSRPVVPGSLRAIQQNNQAAAAAGKQPTVLPAAPAAPLKPGLGNSPMRESKFDESVNLMRRLSTMLKG